MGLLGNMDPYALAQIVSLLTARKGDPNLGMTIATMAGQREQSAARQQQMKMQQMQYQQQQQAMQDQNAKRALAAKAYAPGQEGAGPMPDGQSPLMVGQGGGDQEYMQGLRGIDPAAALGMQSQLAQMNQRESTFAKIDPKDYTPASIQKYQQSKNPGDLIPYHKPDTPYGKIEPKDYTPDSFRKFAASGNYQDLIPYRAPEKPAPSQLYEGATGPMWLQPPTKGSETQPVVGPDGKPLPAKKAQSPLTESQGTASFYLGMMSDAEKATNGAGFDPSTTKNQTLLAFARGDLPKLPKVAQNAMAGAPAQKYAQGMFQWTEAMLRATTGATAPEPEVWRVAKTYYPMPGDTSEVIKQKNEARIKMQDYIRIKAGHGAEQVDAAQAARPQAAPLEDPLGIRK